MKYEEMDTGQLAAGANSAVKKVISNCVECQRFRERVGEQKMENLPVFRSKEAAPFQWFQLSFQW